MQAIAWKAQHRLHGRYEKLLGQGVFFERARSPGQILGRAIRVMLDGMGDRVLAAASLAGLLVLASGCKTGASTGDGGTALDIDQAAVARDPASAITPDALSAAVVANNGFAVALYAQVNDNAGSSNLLTSPLSASLALTMTYAGAAGDTATQMAVALQFQPGAGASIFDGQNALSQALASRGQAAFQQQLANNVPDASTSDYALQVVNSVWGEKTYPWATPFLTTLAKSYGTGVYLEDFIHQWDAGRVAINDWVSQETWRSGSPSRAAPCPRRATARKRLPDGRTGRRVDVDERSPRERPRRQWGRRSRGGRPPFSIFRLRMRATSSRKTRASSMPPTDRRSMSSRKAARSKAAPSTVERSKTGRRPPWATARARTSFWAPTQGSTRARTRPSTRATTEPQTLGTRRSPTRPPMAPLRSARAGNAQPRAPPRPRSSRSPRCPETRAAS
jgi:hypothetical protein